MQLVTLKTSEKMKKLSDANPHKGTKILKSCYDLVYCKRRRKQAFFAADRSWVDASDVGQQPGHFSWADGTEMDAAFWFNGHSEPNSFGAGRETCVFLYSGNGKLYDLTCSRSDISFICEVAEKDLLCL